MTVIETERAVAVPEPGHLVSVRDRWWIVESVRPSSLPSDPLNPARSVQHTLVRLVPIDDKGSTEPLAVFWETEPGTEVRPRAELPDPSRGVDSPTEFSAYLDAARWGAIASADPRAFQSPFRAGIDIEDYQLLPLVNALRMPRVAMLIADDVGLGKTIEAGLIAQELVLRSQARKILIVCPPSLCGKWQREMREKFGLMFEIVDTDYVRRLRRERGVGINPFRSHPRLIVSMEWVKFESQMRWFDDILPVDLNTYPRAFDLLIVDEAHNIAPSASGNYARDSMRTKAIRRLAPHFEHRLFLTATPHNGYRESYEALLEMLDPNRFTKGIAPNNTERDQVIVRRLKSHLRDMLPDGESRFSTRRINALKVELTPGECELFDLLDQYTKLRITSASTLEGTTAARFVTLLLKKRLLSSPAAFKHTLDKHIETLGSARVSRATLAELERARDALDSDNDDSEDVSGCEIEALALAAAALPDSQESSESDDLAGEHTVLARMRARSLPYRQTNGASYSTETSKLLNQLREQADQRVRQADSKTTRLFEWLRETCYPDGVWNDERVIVFTEYRATLNYLKELFEAPHPDRPAMGGRIELFHGSLEAKQRERIIREFNYDPRKTRVRILLATDAAAEGIDLHLACHRLVHIEVPFNPNKMEQRNGRIDRHRQKSPTVDIYHFASTATVDAHQTSRAGYDYSFLLRVAEKVNEIREDLGSVASVLEERIEAQMLRTSDTSLDLDYLVEQRQEQAWASFEQLKRRFSADSARVRDQYQTSIKELDISPTSVERAVQVALKISGQPQLTRRTLERSDSTAEVFEVGDLGGTWGETLRDLYNMVESYRLPVTFDSEVARGHHDVAYLHIGHPFVARCLRTLRAQMWGASGNRKLNRITVRLCGHDEAVAVAHARVVVTGADGSTLDEVIAPAAVRVAGRHGRLNVGETQSVIEKAFTDTPRDHVRDRYIDQWSRIRPALEQALMARAEEVRDQRSRRMDAKRDDEEKRLRGTLTDLRQSIERRLAEFERSELAEQLRLPDFDEEEQRQFKADVDALRKRIERIDSDADREAEILRRRYNVRDVNWFPIAVEILVPATEPR